MEITQDIEPTDSKAWKRFEAFHKLNPHVYEIFSKISHEAKQRGFNHIGAKFIVEIIRWETHTKTDGDIYKMNNNYFPYYARLFMKDNPEYRGFFRTRRVSKL